MNIANRDPVLILADCGRVYLMSLRSTTALSDDAKQYKNCGCLTLDDMQPISSISKV